mmetsp:Transcript_11588/g.48707  ORF Transcript_11588/g.48707 Transcript_11588/m.48707 type:complete len:226 (-) Transcript_11588:448-1125(-)
MPRARAADLCSAFALLHRLLPCLLFSSHAHLLELLPDRFEVRRETLRSAVGLCSNTFSLRPSSGECSDFNITPGCALARCRRKGIALCDALLRSNELLLQARHLRSETFNLLQRMLLRVTGCLHTLCGDVLTFCRGAQLLVKCTHLATQRGHFFLRVGGGGLSAAQPLVHLRQRNLCGGLGCLRCCLPFRRLLQLLAQKGDHLLRSLGSFEGFSPGRLKFGLDGD